MTRDRSAAPADHRTRPRLSALFVAIALVMLPAAFVSAGCGAGADTSGSGGPAAADSPPNGGSDTRGGASSVEDEPEDGPAGDSPGGAASVSPGEEPPSDGDAGGGGDEEPGDEESGDEESGDEDPEEDMPGDDPDDPAGPPPASDGSQGFAGGPPRDGPGLTGKWDPKQDEGAATVDPASTAVAPDSAEAGQ